MSRFLRIEALSSGAFAPYGDIIDASGKPDKLINGGKCARHHDLARLDFEATGRPGISVFAGQPYSLPHTLTLVERHPLGSQAFIPMHAVPLLVVVASDIAGIPGEPRAFLTGPAQGVNILRNVWHGVLTPLGQAACYSVVDWIGERVNLEEHTFDQPFVVQEG